MLKKGDLIIANQGRCNESWWVMTRDELRDDYHRSDWNADLVSRPAPQGFEDSPWTSWDSQTVVHQHAKVIPVDEWTDEMYAKVAQWALLGG